MAGEERGPAHLSMAALGRLLRGELSAAEAQALFAHVEEGCEDCELILTPVLLGLLDPRRSPPQEPEQGRPDPYDLPVGRSLRHARARAAVLTQARRDVQVQFLNVFDRRKPLPEPRQSSPEWRWAWCELLLDSGRQSGGAAPAGAAELAQLAALLAEKLSDQDYPREVLADLRARAWAELGNAHRVMNSLDAAETALARALERYEQGTRDPLLLARVLDLLGSLLRAQRRFGEALEAFDGARQLYLRAGERHLAGRVAVNCGLTSLYAAQPELAIRQLQRALSLLDFSREPRLTLAIAQNALLALVDAGHAPLAASLLWRCRRLYPRFGSRLDQFRLLGLEAKIAAAAGQHARAEKLFREAIAGFVDEGLPYDVALVSLELAVVLLARRQAADVLELVDDMLETFHAHGIRRESFMTVLTLREAVEQGRADAELIRGIAERLRSLQSDPENQET